VIKTFGDSQDGKKEIHKYIKKKKYNRGWVREIHNKDRQLFHFIRFGHMGKLYSSRNVRDCHLNIAQHQIYGLKLGDTVL